MRARDWIDLLKGTLLGWWEDKAPRLGAALAYYTVLSIAPLLILLTPAAGWLFGREAARERIADQFQQLIGPQGAAAIALMLDVPGQTGAGALTRALGIAVLAFGASGVFAEMQDALNTIWEVTPKPGRVAALDFLRQRFLSFAMVLGICFVLMVSLLISASLSAARAYAGERVKGLATTWDVLNLVASFLIVTLLFAMIFKILPDATIRWRDVWIGAALTSGLFAVGRWVIGEYLGRASIGRYYGAGGSIIALLVWVYYSAQILYLGAEFTKVYSRRTGARVVPTKDAVPVTEEARAQQGIPHKEVVEAVKEVVERKDREDAGKPSE